MTEQAATHQAPAAPGKARLRVLVVEPDGEYASFMDTLLRRVGAAAECVPADGDLALSLAAQDEFALGVVDAAVRMEDGRSLLRALRASTAMPLIALSDPEDDEETVARVLEHADYELVRPFSPRRFRAAVRAIIGRGRAAAPAPPHEEVCVGPLVLHRGRLEARVGERQVVLSPREFSLLHVLASHPGIVFTRDELARQAWGWHAAGESRAVDNVIGRVRQKLGEDTKRPRLILTERGTGYRLAVP